MSEQLKIGLIGAGNWGANYVRNLASLGVLSAVCDLEEGRLERIKGDYPAVRTTTSVDELAGMGLDGCVIATHTQVHHEAGLKMLEAGVHCHIEKPLCESSAQALELCEAAESRNLVLMVGHILLYHPAVEFIRGMIESGELGQVYYISATRCNLGVIRRHENVMWSMAPHDISIVQYLLNDDPVSVSATGQSFVQRDLGIEDVTHLTLKFADHSMASITSSWLDPEKVRLIKVVGSEKMVVFDDMDPRYKLQVHEKGVDWTKHLEPGNASFLSIRSGDVHMPFVKPTEPLKAECQEFIDCIRTGRTPRSSGRQGYANVKLIELGCESLRNNGAPLNTGL
ncbi:MAG: Gfo/Idh/MocA family oxidoreductase [bacterium]